MLLSSLPIAFFILFESEGYFIIYIIFYVIPRKLFYQSVKLTNNDNLILGQEDTCSSIF